MSYVFVGFGQKFECKLTLKGTRAPLASKAIPNTHALSGTPTLLFGLQGVPCPSGVQPPYASAPVTYRAPARIEADGGRSVESELTGRLGTPVECHYPHNPTWHEVRWITTNSAGISTVLRIDGGLNQTARAAVVLIRALGPEGCGYHNDRPWTH